MSDYADELLSQNDQAEAISRAYVSAVAARAGYCTSSPSLDRDSIDITIEAGGLARPRIDLQLKATGNLKQVEGGFTFPLKMKNYNDLRAESVVPRALMVLGLPVSYSDWLSVEDEALLLRRCAYWCSHAGAPEVGNNASVSVFLPEANRFTPGAMKGLMARARSGSLA